MSAIEWSFVVGMASFTLTLAGIIAGLTAVVSVLARKDAR